MAELIEIRYRRINMDLGPLFGVVTFYHKAIIYTNTNGDVTTIAAFPNDTEGW